MRNRVASLAWLFFSSSTKCCPKSNAFLQSTRSTHEIRAQDPETTAKAFNFPSPRNLEPRTSDPEPKRVTVSNGHGHDGIKPFQPIFEFVSSLARLCVQASLQTSSVSKQHDYPTEKPVHLECEQPQTAPCWCCCC